MATLLVPGKLYRCTRSEDFFAGPPDIGYTGDDHSIVTLPPSSILMHVKTVISALDEDLVHHVFLHDGEIVWNGWQHGYDISTRVTRVSA